MEPEDTSRLSILLPYLSVSTCIDKCVSCLEKHSTGPYEVVSVIDEKGAYRAYNLAAATATGDTLAFLNDDMFVAPGWDTPFRRAIAAKTVVTCHLVEPGRIPVNHRNICLDFGRYADSFDEAAFNAYAAKRAAELPEVEVGLGWYMPFAIRREDFIPFETTPGLPNDSILFGVFAARGYRFLRVPSFAYHLQRMSAW